MKELAAFNSRFEADFLARLLESNDIPCIVQANDGGGTFPVGVEIEEVRVFVGDGDFNRAQDLLNSDQGE